MLIHEWWDTFAKGFGPVSEQGHRGIVFFSRVGVFRKEEKTTFLRSMVVIDDDDVTRHTPSDNLRGPGRTVTPAGPLLSSLPHQNALVTHTSSSHDMVS